MLGIDPNIRAKFHSKKTPILDWNTKEPAKDMNGDIMYETFHSDILPNDGWVLNEGDYPETLRDYMCRQWEVDEDFIASEEIFKIKRAMNEEKIELHEAFPLIKEYKNKWWNDFGTIPEEIDKDIKKWVDKIKKEKNEIANPDFIILELGGDLAQKRKKIYHKLLRGIANLPTDATEEIDGINIEDYINDKIYGKHAPPASESIDIPKTYGDVKKAIAQHTNEIGLDTEPEEKTSDNFSFTNNFDHVETDVIYEHFKKGLVDKGHLHLDDLQEFLVSAFEKKETPDTPIFRFMKPDSSSIINVFASYHYGIAKAPRGKQWACVDMLCKFFHDQPNRNSMYRNFSKYNQ